MRAYQTTGHTGCVSMDGSCNVLCDHTSMISPYERAWVMSITPDERTYEPSQVKWPMQQYIALHFANFQLLQRPAPPSTLCAILTSNIYIFSFFSFFIFNYYYASWVASHDALDLTSWYDAQCLTTKISSRNKTSLNEASSAVPKYFFTLCPLTMN